MNLKKLLALEAAAKEGCSLPHEQDDNTLAHDPYAQPTQGGIVQKMTTNTLGNTINSVNYPVVNGPGASSVYIPTNPTAGMWSATTTGTPLSTSIENANPTVITNGDEIVMVMNGGRETLYQTAYNQPINIDGNERRFRMTRKEAQRLAVLLVKAAAEE